MKIIILRHGESLDDIENRYGGFANYDLTEKGRVQAQEVASVLKEYFFDAIYSSPYQRAYETAIEVAKFVNVPVTIDTRIRERNTYGYLSGMNKDQAKALFPADYEKAKDQVLSDEIDGSEKIAAVKKRLEVFFEELKTKSFNNVLLVSHGKTIEILLKYVLQISEKIKFSDCGFVEVELAEKPLLLKSSNCQIESD